MLQNEQWTCVFLQVSLPTKTSKKCNTLQYHTTTDLHCGWFRNPATSSRLVVYPTNSAWKHIQMCLFSIYLSLKFLPGPIPQALGLYPPTFFRHCFFSDLQGPKQHSGAKSEPAVHSKNLQPIRPFRHIASLAICLRDQSGNLGSTKFCCAVR